MAEQTKTRVIQSVGDPGKWQAQYYDHNMKLWFDLGDAQPTKDEAEQRRRDAHTTTGAQTLTMLPRALAFLRNTIAGSPRFGDEFTVINIDAVGDRSLVLDLSDGTSIRLDVERYTREVSR